MINIEDYDLFVFDLDGTIIDTEIYHHKAWNIALSSYLSKEIILSYDEYCKNFHINKQNGIHNYLKTEYNITDVSIFDFKNDIYQNFLNNNNINFIGGVDKLINSIIESNKKFVIVTNTSSSNIDILIKKIPILSHSIKICTKELFKNKKPNPECYLKIIEDFPTERKIGFEDSLSGIHALTQVPEIKCMFIQEKSYYHYNMILENYKNITWINNYNYK